MKYKTATTTTKSKIIIRNIKKRKLRKSFIFTFSHKMTSRQTHFLYFYSMSFFFSYFSLFLSYKYESSFFIHKKVKLQEKVVVIYLIRFISFLFVEVAFIMYMYVCVCMNIITYLYTFHTAMHYALRSTTQLFTSY